MNTQLTALSKLAISINSKVVAQESLAKFIDDIEYVKEKEAEAIKECCFLLAKFMQDNRMKIVEPAY